MFKKIKLYVQMKKLERQMKYELLSHLYLFVSKKEDFITMLHQLPEIINKLSSMDKKEGKQGDE